MDNKKIGKLIAELRKKQNLTQQELGDKVGVGFRAVSKWERGINLPDIGLINDLCKILGISTDELLTGELKKEDKTKDKPKLSLTIKIIISSIILIIGIITTILLYNNNKIYTYNLIASNQEEYHIEGQIVFSNNTISIMINKLMFIDEKSSETKISNYEYKLMTNDTYLFGYGYLHGGNVIEEKTSIKNIADEFGINYSDKTNLKREDIIKNNMYLIIEFIDEKDRIIKEEIEILLVKNEAKK